MKKLLMVAAAISCIAGTARAACPSDGYYHYYDGARSNARCTNYFQDGRRAGVNYGFDDSYYYSHNNTGAAVAGLIIGGLIGYAIGHHGKSAQEAVPVAPVADEGRLGRVYRKTCDAAGDNCTLTPTDKYVRIP